MTSFLRVKKEGLYCEEGDFYIDAWGPTTTNLVTHGHSDHAYPNHSQYISQDDSLPILKHRLGDIKLKTYPYGKKFKLKNCWVSFHPAGHILGSSQIRIEHKNKVYVVSGDYKRAYDPTCESFEVIKCDQFITETTFALPIYHWETSDVTGKKIYDWWQENKERDFASILFCYALGKAQRIMSLLLNYTDEPIYVHGAILALSEIYVQKGIPLIPFFPIQENTTNRFHGSLILAPPSAKGSPWLRRFYPYKTAVASGWMQVRGIRKQKNVDKAFVLSDHPDWESLLQTIEETEASEIITMHGNSISFAKYLCELGFNARSLRGLEFIEDEEG